MSVISFFLLSHETANLLAPILLSYIYIVNNMSRMGITKYTPWKSIFWPLKVTILKRLLNMYLNTFGSIFLQELGYDWKKYIQ